MAVDARQPVAETRRRFGRTKKPDRSRIPVWRRWLARVGPPLLFSIVVLVSWQLVVEVRDIRETLVPKPTVVAQVLYEQRAFLLENAWVTLKEILIGFVIALVIGLSLASIIASSRWAERAVYPWMIASQMVPIPAIAPILVLWFGFGILPKVIVVGLIAFFPLAVNAVDGLTSPQTSMIDLMRTLRASRSRIFWTVRVPAASPFIFSGAKIAVALSTIGAVFGEWVGSSEGLGFLILTFNNQSATPEVFAAILLLSIVGITLFGLVALLERVMLPWYHSGARAREAA